jgi:hypothetical protein
MPKRYALPKRFSAALSEDAHARLRRLNQRWKLGNNYLLVVVLEKLDRAFGEFIKEYGTPSGKMRLKA